MICRPVVVAGARPNFVKVAPLIKAFAEAGVRPLLVHTGQHYDAAMSGSFFESLGIPEPDVNLGVGSGTHAAQTAAVMVAFEEWLHASGADCVLVVGDVNSTVACTLVAAKAGIPVGHIEAGLRSFDRTMPEEVNRLVVDALATWLFTPSRDGDENLLAEGIDPSRIHRVGNVMVDSLLTSLPTARQRTICAELGLPPVFGLVTLHRPALVDDAERLVGVVDALMLVAELVPLVFPVHPRTRAMLERCGITDDRAGLLLIEPQGYLDFLALEDAASLVLTDSGGVQEETTALGVPCVTLRENTERPTTVVAGSNQLVGYSTPAIVAAARQAMAVGRRQFTVPLWDGQASARIVQVLRASPEPESVTFVPPALRNAASPEFVAGRSPVALSGIS